MERRMTSWEIILLAAGDLHGRGRRTFSAADLVVEAWGRDPERFGLPGHPHPHSNKVLCELSGRTKLNPVARGLLARVAPSTYRLTELGLAELARIRDPRAAATDYLLAREVLDHPAFVLWRATQEAPARDPFPPGAANLRVRLAAVAGRPLTGPRRSCPAVAAQDVSDALAFLEVVAARGRTAGRRASA